MDKRMMTVKLTKEEKKILASIERGEQKVAKKSSKTGDGGRFALSDIRLKSSS